LRLLLRGGLLLLGRLRLRVREPHDQNGGCRNAYQSDDADRQEAGSVTEQCIACDHAILDAKALTLR
jgi:hypothetical protein